MNKNFRIKFDLRNQMIKTEDVINDIGDALFDEHNTGGTKPNNVAEEFFTLISHESTVKYNEKNTMIFNETIEYNVLSYMSLKVNIKSIDKNDYKNGTYVDDIIVETKTVSFEDFENMSNLIDEVINNLKNK